MANCHGLSLETLHGIAAGENDIPALIQEVGDYEGPTALLLVDAAGWLAGRKGNGVKPLGQSWTLPGGGNRKKGSAGRLIAHDGRVRMSTKKKTKLKVYRTSRWPFHGYV